MLQEQYQSLLESLQDKIPDLLKVAYQEAKKSPDTSNQNGAVLINWHGEILAVARNEFPQGTEASPENLERPKKYDLIEHAERNIIYTAAKMGISTRDKIVVCPWYACENCARALACSGIGLVIGHKPRMDTTPERWRSSVECGDGIMNRAGMFLYYWDKPLNLDFTIRVNETDWTP